MAKKPTTLKIDVPWDDAAARLLNTPAGKAPPRKAHIRKKKVAKKPTKR